MIRDGFDAAGTIATPLTVQLHCSQSNPHIFKYYMVFYGFPYWTLLVVCAAINPNILFSFGFFIFRVRILYRYVWMRALYPWRRNANEICEWVCTQSNYARVHPNANLFMWKMMDHFQFESNKIIIAGGGWRWCFTRQMNDEHFFGHLIERNSGWVATECVQLNR